MSEMYIDLKQKNNNNKVYIIMPCKDNLGWFCTYNEIKHSKTTKISCILMNWEYNQISWQQHVQSSFDISIYILMLFSLF